MAQPCGSLLRSPAGGALAHLARNAPGAVLWVMVIVPPAFGFWLVAGDIAGVPESRHQTLVVAALLSLGIATLLQVLRGYRMPIFEGPASTYLAAVAVVGVGGQVGADAITGGLLAAGVFVLVLGALRVDRLLARLFTPLVATTFLMIVAVMVLPDTIERALGISSAEPLGTPEAWLAMGVLVTVGLGGRAIRALRPYTLALGLLAGVLVYFGLAGFEPVELGSGWRVPAAFPWGEPQLSASIVAPFLLAGLLASFNAIASIGVMARGIEAPAGEGANRRGLILHGVGQAVGACVGNVLGNVPRLDSLATVRMIDNESRAALGLAAALVICLAFVGPFIDLVAQLPLTVSAAMLGLILGVMVFEGIRQSAAFGRKRWLVVAPALAPTLVWLLVADSLSELARLLANPLFWGVGAAIVLERTVDST